MALALAILNAIAALAPLIEKLIEWIKQHRDSMTPRQRRRVGIVMNRSAQLRQKCEELESHGEAIGCVAQEGEIGSDDDDT